MVTANKASLNVVITGLDAAGLPWGAFTVPAGPGAHGVTFGKKSQCDTDGDGVEDTPYPAATCYYAYVTNTFEDYVSTYDSTFAATYCAGGSPAARRPCTILPERRRFVIHTSGGVCMLPLVEIPTFVRHYAPWFALVFSPEAFVQFQRYISGLIISEDNTVEGINRLFVIDLRNQSRLNRWLGPGKQRISRKSPSAFIPGSQLL